MRLCACDKFWVVTDATKDSVIGDVLFQTDIEGLELQFIGGLSHKQNPTIYTVERFALLDAQDRLRRMSGQSGQPNDSQDFRTIFDDFQKDLDKACDKLAMDLGVGK